MKTRQYLPVLLIILALAIIFSGCINPSGNNPPNDPDNPYDEADLTAVWTAYNDCVASFSENAANVTEFNTSTTSGTLLKFSDGSDTSITVVMEADNLSPWGYQDSGMPNPGTDANDTFMGIVDLDGYASYSSSSVDWYYQVTFSGLDPAKSYAFVTTANRDNTYNPSRFTKFSIIGADTYANISSAGVTKVSDDVLKMNSGENTATGYVVAWTNITAVDGSFTVRSENVGLDGPGDQYRSYGLQGFMLKELAP